MRLMRWLGVAALLGLVVIVGGYWSGSQPDRDEVAAARASLGIELISKRIDVGEVTLHVVLAGPEDGPPVVLLHGFPEFWYAWRGPMAELAAAGFRVIVPDQRGYNRSDKPSAIAEYRIEKLASDIAGLAGALGYEHVALAGHDWGGGVAWQVALDYPDLISRLAILDTPHPRAFESGESSEDTIDWWRSFILLPWLPDFAARFANWKLLESNLRGTSRPGTFPDEHFDFFRAAWARDGAIRTMAHWYRASAEFGEPRHGDARISIPTLMLIAPDDAFIPGDLTLRSMAFLDRGELVELDSGTHWVIQEEPEVIGRHLSEFFSR